MVALCNTCCVAVLRGPAAWVCCIALLRGPAHCSICSRPHFCIRNYWQLSNSLSSASLVLLLVLYPVQGAAAPSSTDADANPAAGGILDEIDTFPLSDVLAQPSEEMEDDIAGQEDWKIKKGRCRSNLFMLAHGLLVPHAYIRMQRAWRELCLWHADG